MVVELDVTSGNGTFFGSSTNIKGYSVVEDATPINVADTTGGVGTMTVQADMDTRVDGSLLLIDNTVVLSDDNLGTTTGVVSAVDDDNGDLTITAEGAMAKLTSVFRVPPYIGTLTGAFNFYLGLCGITDHIVIDSSFNTRNVAHPGWYGSVWDNLKQILSAEKAEIAYVSNDIVIRPLRKFTAVTYRDSDVKRSVERGDTAQTVGIYLYDTDHSTNSCAYPVGAFSNDFMWTQNADVQTLGATDVITQTYDIQASLTSVQQPVCVNSIDRYYKDSSRYTVLDKDSNVVNAEQWTAQGGDIHVEIGENSSSLIVTYYGANIINGPFTIAYPDFKFIPKISDSSLPATNADYPKFPSLRIVGSGVFYTKELHTFQTSAPLATSPTTLGTTVDNPYINTYAQLQDCAAEVIGAYSAATQSLSVTTTGINRVNVSGNYHYPTFQDFDNDQDTTDTFDSFDIRFDGWSFPQFDDYYVNLVRSDFANQAFGNVAGARVLKGQAWYRIDTCTHTEANDQYTATEDTLFSDFDAMWNYDASFADFDAWWEKKSFNEFDRIPLWVQPPAPLTGGGIGVTYPSETTYPGNGTYPGYSNTGTPTNTTYPGADTYPSGQTFPGQSNTDNNDAYGEGNYGDGNYGV